MLPGEALDFDHDDNHPGFYLGFSHASCNRSAGATKGNLARKSNRRRSVVTVKLERLAVDIDVGRESTFLVGAGRGDSGVVRVALLGTWPGGDVAVEVADAVRRLNHSRVVLDPATAGTLTVGLRRAGVRAVELDARTAREAEARFTDLFRARKIEHTRSLVLDRAVEHARLTRRATGDRLDLRAEVTPAPIRAAALAVVAMLDHRRPRIYVLNETPKEETHVSQIPQ
jgi:hypothetical protein